MRIDGVEERVKSYGWHCDGNDIKGLTFAEHHMNNEWFNSMLSMLKDDGELYVPMLNKSFNKLGEEVTS